MLEKYFYLPQYVLLILVYMFPRNLASTVKMFRKLFRIVSACLLACREVVVANGRITECNLFLYSPDLIEPYSSISSANQRGLHEFF